MRRLVATWALAAALSPGSGRAASRALEVDLRRDLALTAVAAAAAAGLDGLSASARGCVICGSGRVDDGARDALRLGGPEAIRDARRASDRLVSFVIPGGALAASAIPALAGGAPRELLEDAVVVAQAALLAADLNAIAKQTLGRARPSAAAGDRSGRSFYSAHTSRAFALGVASATVATIRGRRGAGWIWAGGLALAAGVGYLRLASDSHWLTDVAAGAAIGGATGFAVPWLGHRGAPLRRLEVTAAPGGVAVVF